MAGYLGRIEEFDENVESWDCYTERVEQFFKANKITEDDQKVAVLITSLGSRKYQELRDTVSPKKPSELSYNEINEAMSKRYNPKGTIVLQRYRFHTHFQKEESITEFTTALRRLAAKCEFKTFLDEALRDQFVVGLKDGNIRRKLLGTVELNFEAAQKTALAMEAATKDCLEMSTSKSAVPCNKVSSKESSTQQKKKPARVKALSQELFLSLQNIFPGSDPLILRVLQTNPSESNLNTLSNLVVEAMVDS